MAGGRSRGEAAALALLALLAAATAAQWALAFGPLSPEAPEWLRRARFVCFNAPPGGLPDASGWLLLVGQPLGLLAALFAAFGRPLRAGLRGLAARRAGRAALASLAALLALGAGAVASRVAAVSTARAAPLAGLASASDASGWPRLDRAAPELALLDQSGERVSLADLHGRPALVAFAFAHCEAVCPALVRQALDAQERLRARSLGGELAPERVPRVVLLTLDPWRDTPSRLPHLAREWKLGSDASVLSGSVEEVNAALDRWGVVRERDPSTGELAHPPLVYVLDASGRIAFAASGGAELLAELVLRG